MSGLTLIIKLIKNFLHTIRHTHCVAGLRMRLHNGLRIGLHNGLRTGLHNVLRVGLHNGLRIGLHNGLRMGLHHVGGEYPTFLPAVCRCTEGGIDTIMMWTVRIPTS